ncbi:MAG TPA: glutamate mutase L [Anaerolineales bacterium]|nr:glutamate mutase L [Anaerolineales bacterium]
MPTSLIDADSVLAIEIGTVTTRVILFDVVEGHYRFLGQGVVPTTFGAPFNDVSMGVKEALDQLRDITGRILFNAEGQLVVPSQPSGTGVDACVATVSVGPPLKVVAIGLLEDVSTESAKNLATTTYAQVVEKMSLNDRRDTVERLDTILQRRPDLIVVAGGTEGGAKESVLNLLEAVGLACYLIPKDQRPEVLFAGNSELVKNVQESIGTLANLHIAPNVRQSYESEQLTPSQPALAQIFRLVRSRQLKGIPDIDLWTGNRLLPAATAFGRTIRYISKEYAETHKGVMGVDVGASATTIASAFAGDLRLSIHPGLGLGENLPQILNLCSIGEITRWVSVDIPENYVRDYIYNKAIYPSSVPITSDELAIEQAIACQAMLLAVRQASQSYPSDLPGSLPGLLPWFEPIIASGSVLTKAPSRSQTLMMILNGLQPTGVTTIAMDRNNLAASLGAAASVTPLLTIQSLDAANFGNLCTVISPVGKAPPGTPILRIRLTNGDVIASEKEIQNGTLTTVELPVGQTGTLHLTPLHRFDVGMGGLGRGGTVRVIGGSLGVVIDARGRPLRMLAEPSRRRESLNKWLETVASGQH